MAEFVGTMLLLVAVVGSGVATSVDGAASTQLFQHAVVVGVALAALIVTLGPVSGAHFNPAVTLAALWLGAVSRRTALRHVTAQLSGAVAGVVVANLMFGLPAVATGTFERAGAALWGSEVLATAGLVVVVFGLVRAGNSAAVPVAVGAWVAGAIFFTSSMSFANPAVSIGRMFTNSWTGIVPGDVPGFVMAEVAAVVVAAPLVDWLFRPAVPARRGPGRAARSGATTANTP